MAGKSILKRFNAFSTASRHHTSDFEPHDTFVENLPALSANALGFVMGHQALPLSQIQISTASGLPAEVLYPANGTKKHPNLKNHQKKMHFQQKKNCKTSANLPTSVRPADLGGFFYQCKPPKVACVCRVSLGWNQAAPLACYKCPLHWSCTGFHLLRLSMDTNGYPSETYKNN